MSDDVEKTYCQCIMRSSQQLLIAQGRLRCGSADCTVEKGKRVGETASTPGSLSPQFKLLSLGVIMR